jgi:hypothetical protein
LQGIESISEFHDRRGHQQLGVSGVPQGTSVKTPQPEIRQFRCGASLAPPLVRRAGAARAHAHATGPIWTAARPRRRTPAD